MPMQAILTYLQENQRRFVDSLVDYVRFPSVSAQPQHAQDLKKCAEWACRRCKEIGLKAELRLTPGNPVLVASTPRSKGSKRPHFLVYGHYDVQPAEPFELWKSPPFEARLEGDVLYGRGACDNKGQHLAHLNAVEAYLKTGTSLPCDLTFIIEGEEEVGSSNLAHFLKKYRKELSCDAVVISDTGIPQKGMPALTYGLRGISALEVKVIGPNRDLHSGIFGGSVDNPAMALCQILGQLRDRRGRVVIPGFYDDVEALSAYERKQLARLPYDKAKYAKFLGVRELFGEKGFSAWEQRTARPTLEINGLTSGYQGEGSKTIIPSWASAKITMRLVPNQNPAKIARLASRYLKAICPPSVRIAITEGHGGEPYLFSPTNPYAKAALGALEEAFEAKPVLMREGGSIPIVNDFRKILGADTLLLGLGLPDDNAHSPNEKFDLGNYRAGMRLSALLWPALSSCKRKG